MEKHVDTGEIVCGFGVLKTYEGQKDFDETYKEVIIKKRVKKIGESDEDFIIEEFEEIKETPIKEVIASQVDDVGIEAYMRPYLMSGEPLPNVVVSDQVQDFTGFPEDVSDAMKVGDNMMKAFDSLDPDLRGDAKDVETFLNSLSKEKIDAYIASKLGNVEKGKEDDK